MDPISAILFVVLFFFLLTLAFYVGLNIKLFSAITISALLSYVLLNVLFPPENLTNRKPDAATVLYLIVTLFFICISLVYIVYKCLTDHRPRTEELCGDII